MKKLFKQLLHPLFISVAPFFGIGLYMLFTGAYYGIVLKREIDLPYWDECYFALFCSMFWMPISIFVFATYDEINNKENE